MRGAIFFFLLLFAAFCRGQSVSVSEQQYADSLVKTLKNGASDSIKARTNFLLAQHWATIDLNKAKNYLKNARQLSRRNAFLQGLYWFYEGEVYYKTDLAKSNLAYLKSDSLLKSIKSKEAYSFRAKAAYSHAYNLYDMDQEKELIKVVSDRAIPFAQQSADTILMVKCYGLLERVFNNNSQYEKAISYIEKSIEILKVNHANSKEIFSCYVKAAFNNCYLFRFKKVKAFLDKAKPLSNRFKNSLQMMEYYETESIYYMISEGNSEKALGSLDKGIALAKTLKDSYRVNTFTMQKYNVYANKKDYKKALPFLEEVAKDKEFMKTPVNRQSIYKEFDRSYSFLGKLPEAYKWLQKYKDITDSLNESQLKHDINALEIKFRNAENQKKIVELNSSNEKNKLKAKNNRLIGLITSLCLLVVALFGWLLYRKSKKLAIQEERSHKQEIKEMEQREQIKMAQAMLQGQEEERKRVAQDLHDGLGGMLAGVKMNLSVFATKGKKEDAGGSDLHGIIEQLDQSASELRRIAYNMMPEALLRFGLETSLGELCESFVTDELAVDFQYYGHTHTLLIQEQMSIYRIVQELLTNAYKHAHAKKILVQCSQNEGVFLVTVEDDGKGFDLNAITPGMGLANIRNRVDYLQGTIAIAKGPNERGTLINIELKLFK